MLLESWFATDQQYAVEGSLSVPDYLRFLEPLVIVPQTESADTAPAPVSVLVVMPPRPVRPRSRRAIRAGGG